MLLQNGQKIVFIGDSITDCGRRDEYAPYGNGYVNMIRNMLLAQYPMLKLTIVNRGIGRNTSRDLRQRWNDDVLAEQPDWVSVMIGINDVRRVFRNRAADAVPLPEYSSILRELMAQTQQHTSARLILMTPYMIEPDASHPMRAQMDLFGNAVREIAHDCQAIFISVQQAFNTVLQHTTPADWSEDQVHPNQPGHMVIALEWLRAIGFVI
jgi:lysophospholipase L1-like esterase